MNSGSKLQTALSSAIVRTIESMTFEEVEILDDGSRDFTSANEIVWAKLPILKPLTGELVLLMSHNYCRSLINNVYGSTDNESNLNAENDILAEIANTIAGRFIDGLIPSDTEFLLGLPTTGKGNAPESAKKITTILLRMGDHPLVISIHGEDFKPFNKS